MYRMIQIILSMMIFTSCNKVDTVVHDPKLKEDSREVIEDLLQLGENIIREEIELPKEDKKN